MLDHGIPCALGTDAPIEDIDPLQNIYAAVERKTTYQSPGVFARRKLTKFQAIQLYTIGSAQAIGKDNERGLIKPGYVADFSIFDRDLFAGTTEDILKGRVEKTVVAGRIVYNRNKKA